MLRRSQLTTSAPLGTEVNQQELANSAYPEVEMDEIVITEHPAFMDLLRANVPIPEVPKGQPQPESYTPVILKEEETLTEFISQSLKLRRGMQAYEFSIVNHSLITWTRRPTPKETMNKTFTAIGGTLAKLFWNTDNAVGIRISLNDGIEIGIYNGDPTELEYDPYLKFQYNVTT